MSLAMSANFAAIKIAGYDLMFDETVPTIICAHEPLEMWSALSWDSLASHAVNYILCDCGRH